MLRWSVSDCAALVCQRSWASYPEYCNPTVDYHSSESNIRENNSAVRWQPPRWGMERTEPLTKSWRSTNVCPKRPNRFFLPSSRHLLQTDLLVTKEEKKLLIGTFKAKSENGHVTKETWMLIVQDEGVTEGLAESIWNAFNKGSTYVTEALFL